MEIEQLVKEAYGHARESGFWDEAENRNFGEAIALMHSELSEALEEHRMGKDFNEVYYLLENPGKPEGIPIEFADVIIRIADWCGGHDIDLEAAIKAKLAYNKTRPRKHNRAY